MERVNYNNYDHINTSTYNQKDDPLRHNEFYNLNGIPYHSCVNVNELNFINGNVMIDKSRAIILKPITREKIVEVMVEEIIEKVICIPQIQVVDKYVEVVKPVIKYKIKEVKRPVTVEKIKKVPVVVEEEKILEVPEIQYVDKYVDVPTVVQKEKIIEVPLPVVHERTIPVLNVSKNERIQELDTLDYNALDFGDEEEEEDNNESNKCNQQIENDLRITNYRNNNINGFTRRSQMALTGRGEEGDGYRRDTNNDGNAEIAIRNIENAYPNINALSITTRHNEEEVNKSKGVGGKRITQSNSITRIDRINNMIQIRKFMDDERKRDHVKISINTTQE